MAQTRQDRWLVAFAIVAAILLARLLFDALDLGLPRLVESLLAGLLAVGVFFTLRQLQSRYRRP